MIAIISNYGHTFLEHQSCPRLHVLVTFIFDVAKVQQWSNNSNVNIHAGTLKNRARSHFVVLIVVAVVTVPIIVVTGAYGLRAGAYVSGHDTIVRDKHQYYHTPTRR